MDRLRVQVKGKVTPTQRPSTVLVDDYSSGGNASDDEFFPGQQEVPTPSSTTPLYLPPDASDGDAPLEGGGELI